MLRRNRGPNLTSDERRQIINAYHLEQKPLKVIEADFGRAKSAIYKILNEAAIPHRRNHGASHDNEPRLHTVRSEDRRCL